MNIKTIKKWGKWGAVILIILFLLFSPFREKSDLPEDKEKKNKQLNRNIFIIIGIAALFYFYHNKTSKLDPTLPTDGSLMYSLPQSHASKSPINVEGGQWVFVPDKQEEQKN